MHTYTVSYIRSVIHTHTDTHTTCIVPLHELRYQPCAYEIVVNRLAFHSKYSFKPFFFLFRRGSFGFFGSTLASSLLFDFFFKRDLSTVNILPHLFHFMSALEPLQRAPYIYIENNIWWKYLKPINEQVHIF